jgi:acetyl-CoA acetyltransferase
MTVFDGSAVLTGIGQSAIGRKLGRSGLALTAEACLAAIADAGLTPDDIDGIASYPGADNADPGYAGAGVTEVMDALGMRVNWYLGAAETAGQFGPVIDAAMAVATGLANHVVVFRTLTESSAQGGLGRGAVMPGGAHGRANVARHWSEWTAPFGGRAPNLLSQHAMRYMHDFGMTREEFGQIALTARRNAATNPAAVFREPLTMEEYLSARMISTPFCLYDCDVPVDGSTAVIVSRATRANDLRREPITIEAVGCAVHGRYAFDQCDFFDTPVHHSSRMMWSQTDLTPADVDVAELYDGFAYLPIVWLEALGFCGRGEAGGFISGGKRIARDGELPINTQGGQLSGGRLHGLGFLHEAGR